MNTNPYNHASMEEMDVATPIGTNDDDDDDIMSDDQNNKPFSGGQSKEEIQHFQKQSLVKYEVAETIFEVPKRYTLEYAIGKGAYGTVCSAGDTLCNEKVAIKKIIKVFNQNSDFQKRILREIKLLKHFSHENIICLVDLISPKSKSTFEDVYIVTDLMETDLRQIVKSEQPLSNQHIQYFMYQILRALKYIHSANVLHRDLKPGNILLNADCELKICDFGLSRGIDFDNGNPVMSTHYVATRWYRAPELLLMWDKASKSIDIWSVGCIFAELLNRKVLFPGSNYLNQIDLIIDVLGSPKPEEIRGSDKARNYVLNLPFKRKKPFKTLFPDAPPLAIDLLTKLLDFDPIKRITVENALEHPYFESLHDPSDEPIAQKFDFSFEKYVTNDNIKEFIYKEIIDWNLKGYNNMNANGNNQI